MKKINLFSLLFIAAMSMSVFTITSCKSDVEGCTNPAASNYDAEADTDDGSCILDGCTDEDGDNYDAAANNDDGTCTFFNRFEGNYSGTFTCGGALAALFTSADAGISANAGTTNGVLVLVSSSTLPAPVPVSGTIIDKDNLNLNTTLDNVPLEILPDGMGGVVMGTEFTITVTGDLVRQANGNMLGDLTFNLVETAINGQVPGTIPDISDTCTYDAIRQ